MIAAARFAEAHRMESRPPLTASATRRNPAIVAVKWLVLGFILAAALALPTLIVTFVG